MDVEKSPAMLCQAQVKRFVVGDAVLTRISGLRLGGVKSPVLQGGVGVGEALLG